MNDNEKIGLIILILLSMLMIVGLGALMSEADTKAKAYHRFVEKCEAAGGKADFLNSGEKVCIAGKFIKIEEEKVND